MALDKSSMLTLECMAIGSLPHKSLDNALRIVSSVCNTIPFWPQMVNISKNEDMIVQFLEGMPSFFIDKETGKSFLNSESETFFEDLEEFFTEYEEIVENIDSPALDKYALSDNYAMSFKPFLQMLTKEKPDFAKGQIVGPFTLSTTLVDEKGRCAYYDETLREIIVKTLTLKALYQIREMKRAFEGVTPIIFIDEPSVSQLGTSAYITIEHDEVVKIIKEISDIIKANGAMSAVHCCGKCDWTVPVKAGVDVINFDAYSFAQNLSLFSDDLKAYLGDGRKIAWGIVPTLDKEALIKSDLNTLIEKFDTAVKYLTNKGINEKLIIQNSLITPSCGAGALSEELAEKAMNLTKELSRILKERYEI